MTLTQISYQIIFTLNKNIDLQIGKLGWFSFLKGTYIYTGSAKKVIDKRIERHLRKSKKLHWHIDYLLNHSSCTVKNVVKSHQNECSLNQSTEGTVIAQGFGASDCRSGCNSHLKYISLPEN